jgi:hypothetical protein
MKMPTLGREPLMLRRKVMKNKRKINNPRFAHKPEQTKKNNYLYVGS